MTQRREREQRPRRRNVRIHCTLAIEGRSYGAFTRNVSDEGAYVLVREPVEGAVVGQAVRLRLELIGDGSVVDCPGEIAWIDPNDEDIDNALAVGIGIQLHLDDAHLGDRLRRFVEEFRYVVLCVGGSAADRSRYREMLSIEYTVVHASSSDEVFAILDAREVAVLLVLPETVPSPLALLDSVSARYPRLAAARIVHTRSSDIAELRRLINLGGMYRSLSDEMDAAMVQAVVREAVDRYALDVENQRLAGELERAKRSLERENAFLRQRLTGVEGFDKIIGHSPQLRAALMQLERVRRTDAPVYVHGETGTGKELVARALHSGGPRADQSYIVQNCAGMTETLLQSTLFGHRRGAFTGADRDHRGVFLDADGGTLFLDEVGELSPATQAMLLRVLQEGEIMPVGATRPVKVNVRIISATHKNLREEVKAGRFREDLLYRLVVVTIHLPALRERQGDTALLARHFLDLHCERYGKNIPGIRPDAMAALEAYEWPGNVRELDNEIERMVILSDDGERLGVGTLSPHIAAFVPPKRSGPAARGDLYAALRGQSYDETIERLERMLIREALEAEGSVTRAAARLGIERSRLGKLRKRLGLDD